MRFGIVRNLRKPRTRHHHAGGVDGSGLKSLNRCGVDRMRLSQIVGMNDYQLRVCGISQALHKSLRWSFHRAKETNHEQQSANNGILHNQVEKNTFRWTGKPQSSQGVFSRLSLLHRQCRFSTDDSATHSAKAPTAELPGSYCRSRASRPPAPFRPPTVPVSCLQEEIPARRSL